MPETMPFGMARVAGVFSDGEIVIRHRDEEYRDHQRRAKEISAELANLRDELILVNTELAVKTQRRTDIITRVHALQGEKRVVMDGVAHLMFPPEETATTLALNHSEHQLQNATDPTVRGYTG